MMIQVNPLLINLLLGPWGGLGDDDDAVRDFTNFDMNNEVAVKKIIISKIIEYSKHLSLKGRERVRLALRYGLSKENFDFYRVFYRNLLPFDPPSSPRLFFIWIWEEVFKDEEFIPMDLTNVRVQSDLYESHRASLWNEPPKLEPYKGIP